MNKEKKNLLLFFIVVFVLLFCTSIINFYVDPQNKITNQNKFLANLTRKLLSDEGPFYLNYNWNLRDIKIQSIKNTIYKKGKKCFVLGSSRAWQISSVRDPVIKLKRKCDHFLNLGIPGNSLEDFYIFSKFLDTSDLKKNKFNEILFVIDPWNFSYNKDKRWQRYIKEYHYMKKIVNPSFNSYNYKKLKYISDYLLNYNYLKLSIKSIFLIKDKSISKVLDFDYEIGLSKDVILKDLSVVYNSTILMKKGQNPDRTEYYKMSNSRQFYNEKAFHDFERLILHISNNYKITFIILPYHPIIYQNDIQLIKNFFLIEKKIISLSKRLKISLIGSFNPRKNNCFESDFINDTLHPGIQCVRKILLK